MYYTMMDFPRWFRVRTIDWLTFAYLNQSEYEECGITVSMLMRFMVKTFFPPEEKLGHNISTGGILICQNGESITIYGDFVAVVVDEKALKALHNMVGASGCLCCIKRRNVIGRCEHFEHLYLVLCSPSPTQP